MANKDLAIKKVLGITMITMLVIGLSNFSSLPFLMEIKKAFAHQDPDGDATINEANDCNSNALGTGLTIFKGVPPTTGPVLPGDALTSKLDLQELADTATLIRCGFDGGTITITNPDGTSAIVNSPVGTPVPCVGGTTNAGDTVGVADCAAALTSFTSNPRAYTVKCTDDGKNGDPVDGFLRWTGAYAGKSHRNSADNLAATGSQQQEIECLTPMTTLTKTVSPTTGTAPLNVIYTYTEENTSTGVVFKNVVITDVDDDATDNNGCTPITRGSDAPGDNDALLEPSEKWVFTCPKTGLTVDTINTAFVEADICGDATCTSTIGTHTGKAGVTGNDPNERSRADVDIKTSCTELTKERTNPSGTGSVSGTYTYKEHNCGDVTLTSVKVTDVDDDAEDNIGCTPLTRGADAPGDNDALLEPTETWTFTCPYFYTNPGTTPLTFINTAIGSGVECNDPPGCSTTGKTITFPDFPNERARAEVVVFPVVPCLPLELQPDDAISMNSIINNNNIVKTIHAEKELCILDTDGVGGLGTPGDTVRDVTVFIEIYEDLKRVVVGADPVIKKQAEVVTCEKKIGDAIVLRCTNEEPPTTTGITPQGCTEQPLKHPQEMDTVNSKGTPNLIKTIEAQKEVFNCNGGRFIKDIVIFTEIFEDTNKLPKNPVLFKQFEDVTCIKEAITLKVLACLFSPTAKLT